MKRFLLLCGKPWKWCWSWVKRASLAVLDYVPLSSLVDMAMCVGSLTAIGIGLWWLDPAWALIGVGGIVFVLTVASRIQWRRGK